MKKVLINILWLLLIIQSSFGQYVKFAKAHGFILSHGAFITHIAIAGGGVVLKGIAKPKYPDSPIIFKNITFTEAKRLSTMNIQTQDLNISFSDSSWLMRDAAMLVKSEKSDSIFRDVNLFGKFTLNDYDSNYDYLYPPSEFFNVEMADSLVNTRSGQTLLLMDIMLTDSDNTRYYSTNQEAYREYNQTNDSLIEVVNEYNDSIDHLKYKPINDLYLKLKNFDYLSKTGKIDSNEIVSLNKIKQYSFYYLFSSKLGYQFSNYYDSIREYVVEIDSIFDIDYSDSENVKNNWSNYTYKNLWNDYTFNDEYTNYSFYCDKDSKQLKIEGEPHYTFLFHKYSYLDTIKVDEVKIDSFFTNYYFEHANLIKNLNYVVFNNATHFGEIAAFYRYLKSSFPKLWDQVYTHYSHVSKSKGDTPRFIGIYPTNEY